MNGNAGLIRGELDKLIERTDGVGGRDGAVVVRG